jgi:hypothetical protein
MTPSSKRASTENRIFSAPLRTCSRDGVIHMSVMASWTCTRICVLKMFEPSLQPSSATNERSRGPAGRGEAISISLVVSFSVTP